VLSGAFAVIASAEHPPCRASAEPEAPHVGCLFAAVGVPHLVFRPRGVGAGKQNAGI